MTKLRFLLLEDDPIDIELIQTTLIQGGIDCDLIQVETQPAFETALDTDAFDLILAGYRLPGWTGLAALALLKQRDLDVPFILVSGTAGEELAIETLKRGATDYVLKQRIERLVPVIHRALRELQERRNRIRIEQERDRFFNLSIDLLCIAGMDGYFRRVNPAFTSVLGYSEAELLTIPCLDLVHPDDRDKMQDAIAHLKTGAALSYFENRYRCQNGAYRWFAWSAHPVSEEGLVYAVARDITDGKTTEATLRQSEAKLRMILESAKDYAIITLDHAGYVTSWNTGAQRVLQYEESEIVGQRGHIIFTPEDQAARKPEEEIYKALTKGRGENERWHVCKDGSRFWGSGLMMPLQDDAGEIQGFLKIMQDKTEQRNAQEALKHQAEELERANHIKDEFLAVLSHELRTPLNPILGWAKLLRTKPFDDASRSRALETIERNAQLQMQLIEDLLDVSRILRGKLTLSATPVELSTIVSAAIETVRLAAEAKSIEIQFDRPAISMQVLGDAARLQQVVWNLLSNAVKFTPHNGEILVRLRSHNDDAQIQVIDTGKGINSAFLPFVFEYFRQEDSKTTRKFGGLGLGLAIVRQIVELHGGTVRAESVGEDQGATFIVQLPLMPQTANSISTSNPVPAATDVLLDSAHILLVDDDADTREFEAFVLKQRGAVVTAVASGVEVLQVLDRLIPDVLISDVGMPDMDGYQLIEKIRSRSADQGGNTPAIALTAYAAEADQQKALQTGFQQHLAKPIDPETLVQAVIHLLPDQSP